MKIFYTLVLSLVLFYTNTTIATNQAPAETTSAGTTSAGPASESTDDSCHLESIKSKYMRSVRIDRHAPCDCKPFRVEQFSSNDITYFVEGISRTKGADHRIDISRDDARLLWHSLNSKKSQQYREQQVAKINRSPKLTSYYEDLYATKDLYGFDFVVEGDVLEAITIIEMQKNYSPDEFFVTGGISYNNSKGTQTVGELDVVVYERATCKVVSVGEAKLTKGSTKARKQLARFRRFLSGFFSR